MSTATLIEEQVSPKVGKIDAIPEPDSLYEFVGSTIKEKNAGAFELYTSYNIARLLGVHTSAHKLGHALHEMIFDFRPTIDRRRRPDAAFVSAERWAFGKRPPRTVYWKMVPDLAIEVVSPSDLMYEVIEKVEEYFQVGVRQVWLVLANVEKVYVYESPTLVRVVGSDEELDGGAVVPGFRVALRTLFGDKPEVESQT